MNIQKMKSLGENPGKQVQGLSAENCKTSMQEIKK